MNVYTQYFQKSKVFLYPLLNLSNSITYTPVETYMYGEDYQLTDCKLLCLYEVKDDKQFKQFEIDYLLSNECFHDVKYLDDKILYVFDLLSKKKDYDFIVNGQYSKISTHSKKLILNYFRKNSVLLKYLKSFLHPAKFHKDYSKALDVPLEYIKDVYEILSKPDLNKERYA